MKHFEIECKWSANSPRAFSRARKFVASLGKKLLPKQLKIKDIYLDHVNDDLAAQKIALRVRNCNGKWEATFKTRTEIVDGKAVRREETLPLVGVKNLTQALKTLAQKNKWCGLDTTQLVIQFILTNQRSIFVFDYDKARLEMALDQVTLHVLGRQVKFKEIEVELKRGNKEALDKFALCFTQQTKLKHAQISKVKTAQTLLNLWQK